jgi:riboflavin biosynthesis pyrimidine reductase
MAYERIKTEHAGTKNGGGAWINGAEAKQTAKRQRRRADEIETALSTEERDNRWATANAREAIQEERW